MKNLPTPKQLDQMAAELTPWEVRQGWLVKRDDLFAPLGPGGVNGSKLRQLSWLFANRARGARRVLTAASALSPQHCMTAVVAAIHGLPSLHITAAEPERHPSTAIAKAFGADFVKTTVGYNPALQAELRRRLTPEDMVVPYGITTEAENEIVPFHEVGAVQVKNMPEELEELVVPFGSGNSLTSIIYGLVRHGHKNLRRLVTVGIGPDRSVWVCNRLQRMGVRVSDLPFEWDGALSLHSMKFAAYGDRMSYCLGGIDLHPTYEGKVFRWLETTPGSFRFGGDGRTGFWIVGSEPHLGPMMRYT